jgi:hypothetical protein
LKDATLDRFMHFCPIDHTRNAVELRFSDPIFHISTGGHAEIC